MKLDFAFFAESAKLNQTESADALGIGIDTLVADRFPTWLPILAVVARIEFEQDELNKQHVVQLQCTDPDGAIRVPLAQLVSPKTNRFDSALPIAEAVVFNMPVIEFSKAGTHQFKVSVADQQLGVLRFYVILLGFQS